MNKIDRGNERKENRKNIIQEGKKYINCMPPKKLLPE